MNRLIFTNSAGYLQNSVILETGISDFHKMSIAILKVFCEKHKINENIQCRKYNNFDNKSYLKTLNNELMSTDTINTKLIEFTNILKSVL